MNNRIVIFVFISMNCFKQVGEAKALKIKLP